MGTTLRIAEVSRRSGFSAPTLRYYEEVGLLAPADRTPAGYRIYDDSVLARLAFIARAKALGCSLKEISDLMPHWDDGQCAPVQKGLRTLAAAKLDSTQSRIDDLVAFTADLRRILAGLGSHAPAGPCDNDCGCLGDASVEPDIACTLPPQEMPGRLDQWSQLLTHVTARFPVDGGVRLELDEATPLRDLLRLVEAEHACCRFFAFAVTLDERGVALEVRAPAAGQGTIDLLLGDDFHAAQSS